MKHYTFRRYYLASLVFLVGLLFGCSHSTTVNSSSVIILSKAKAFAHLEAGGLSICGVGDTAVNFDLVPNLSITNDSNVQLHLFAQWEISTLLNDVETQTPPEPILFDTVDLGTVPANGTISLDSIPIITISDSFANQQLSYHLRLGTTNRLFGDYAIDVFDSVPFNSRYRGIINTTESSPTPIAIFDGPDIADWVGDSIFTPIIAYPNPALNRTEVGFSIPNPFDSVRGDIYITPHHIIQSVTIPQPKIGSYTVLLDLSGFSPGLYRLVWTAYKNELQTTCRGNIMVQLQ